MQLLAAGTGWALSGARLFWTTDSGTSWKDITPHAEGSIVDVFFLNASRGWAIFCDGDEQSNMVSFRLASTADSGKTWSTTPVEVPNQGPGELDGRSFIDFVDPRHGWFVLLRSSSSAFSLARLFATNDGGASWREFEAPLWGRPVFATPRDGWISGPTWAGGIYRTHDGGRNWRGSGPTLKGLPPSLPTQPSYGDVMFSDAKRGTVSIWLQASNDAEESRGTALVLYATNNGGRTWKRDRTLVDRGAFTKYGGALSRIGPCTVVSDSRGIVSVLIVAFNDRRHLNRVTLMTVSRGQTSTDNAPSVSSENILWRPGDDIVQLSFTSTEHGWARSSLGDLLSTTDGGRTWKDISPIPVARPYPVPVRIPE